MRISSLDLRLTFFLRARDFKLIQKFKDKRTVY